jgi:uncharacterized membrane protein
MKSPASLFVLLATIGGLILVVLIPPLGGSNETFNFQRAFSVASGDVLIKTYYVPRGVAEIIDTARVNIPFGVHPPYSYTREEFQALADIPLDAQNPVEMEPNGIAVLHPLSYLPQVPVLFLGETFGLRPIVLFYLARFAGLLAGIALTYFAIKAIPIHKHALAAIALLPIVVYSRSQLDADQFTNGLAFLFLAWVMREIVAGGPITRRALAGLIVTGFILAQCKSAYLLLPLYALAIPAERFRSTGHKWAWSALIAAPGLVASFAWMLSLKHGYFAGIHYKTWSGSVYPDGQMDFILSDPLGYAAVVWRTLFTTPFLPVTAFELIGISAPWLIFPSAIFSVFFVGIAAVFICEPVPARGRLQSSSTRSIATLLFLSSAGIILTLLYLQWTRLGGPVIEGFQGRYLIPTLPLLLLLLPSGGRTSLGLSTRGWVILVGTASIVSTSLTVWTNYWS